MLGIHRQTLHHLIFLTEIWRCITVFLCEKSKQTKTKTFALALKIAVLSSKQQLPFVFCQTCDFQHKTYLTARVSKLLWGTEQPLLCATPACVCWSVCTAGSCRAALRSIFCPGERSPFPCRWQMLFYPGGLGTAVINDPRLHVGEKSRSCGHEECRALKVSVIYDWKIQTTFNPYESICEVYHFFHVVFYR